MSILVLNMSLAYGPFIILVTDINIKNLNLTEDKKTVSDETRIRN